MNRGPSRALARHLRQSKPAASARKSIAPLHLGVGCVNARSASPSEASVGVSIPSSSGCWLRLTHPSSATNGPPTFQSPLHRGVGCVVRHAHGLRAHDRRVSIPSSSGCWLRHATEELLSDSPVSVSIPSSSGCWLRLAGLQAGASAYQRFQSPLHRGVGCVAKAGANGVLTLLWHEFQSPLHRGVGCVTRARLGVRQRRPEGRLFQSPLHRGVGCVRRARRVLALLLRRCFNPLFIGVLAASCSAARCPASSARRPSFNPLFIGVLAASGRRRCARVARQRLVSIPSSSGCWLRHQAWHSAAVTGCGFNPLFIGVLAAS